MKLIIIPFVLILAQLCQCQTIEIRGTVRDKSTSMPLPYASVSIENTGIGTIAGSTAGYSIIIPDSLRGKNIIVSYLGYYSEKLSLNKAKNGKLNIDLKPFKHEIEAVIIHPLTPQEVIRRMLGRRLQNYPTSPYFAKGFYIETFTENNKYIDFVEALVAVQNFGYNDTTKSKAYLIQGRTPDDLTKLNLFSHAQEKNYEKDIKKALRKGETTDSIEKNQLIKIHFGGPAQIIFNDPIRKPFNAIDTNEFKKFNYWFGEDSYLDGKELYTINYTSKRRHMGSKIDGALYITKDSYSLVNTNFNVDFQIPVYAKPLLLAFRVKASNIAYNEKVEYKNYQNHYYISKVVMNGHADAMKKYIGHEAEDSKLCIQQAFAVTDINATLDTIVMTAIEPDTPLREQLNGYDEEFWKTHNKIEYE